MQVGDGKLVEQFLTECVAQDGEFAAQNLQQPGVVGPVIDGQAFRAAQGLRAGNDLLDALGRHVDEPARFL